MKKKIKETLNFGESIFFFGGGGSVTYNATSYAIDRLSDIGNKINLSFISCRNLEIISLTSDHLIKNIKICFLFCLFSIDDSIVIFFFDGFTGFKNQRSPKNAYTKYMFVFRRYAMEKFIKLCIEFNQCFVHFLSIGSRSSSNFADALKQFLCYF